MNRSMRLVAPLLMLTILVPAAHAHAQHTGEPGNADAAAMSERAHGAAVSQTPGPARGASAREAGNAAGPRISGAAAGVRATREAATGSSPVPFPPREETTQNRAMMIVGAAGLIVGAIIGDTAGTIFMVAGGGIGLYGLYKYLE